MMLALRDHSFAKAPYLRAGGGIDVTTGEEKLSEADLAAFAHLDPIGMLEAGRPLVGQSEIDDQGRQVGGIIDPEVLWDCTTCGACVEQCPVDIEHVDHIVDMRRYQVMIESEFPAELGGLFRNLENKGNPWGQNQKDRMAWAKDLPFEVPVVTDTIDPDHEYLFWVGCAGAFDDRAKKTTQAVAELMHMAAVGFAVLGTGETCTGDPARRAGNEFLFQMLAQATVETLNEAFGDRATRKIVVTCPHCFNTLSNEYGDLGGHYEVIHHTQLLNRLVRDRRLVVKKDPAESQEGRHLPRPLLPGPAQQGVLAAPGADRGVRGDAEGDAAEQLPVDVLRGRRGPDVDGGEDRQADQPGTHRRGAGHRCRADRHRVPVLQGHAHRRAHRPAGPTHRGDHHEISMTSRSSMWPRCCSPASKAAADRGSARAARLIVDLTGTMGRQSINHPRLIHMGFQNTDPPNDEEFWHRTGPSSHCAVL